MERLSTLVLLAAVAVMGCSGGEAVAPPTETEKTAVAESKAAWTPEKLDAFNKAHEDARTGKDELSNGLPAGKKGK